MEKQLLKQSGIIAVIVTFLALAFWFGFAKLSLGAYNEKNLTKQFLGEDSEVFKTLVIEVGSDTVARIIAGTSSMTRTGTSSYQYQPRIQYDGGTGRWTFKNSGGTETVAFGTVSASYVAAEIGSATANYVLKTNGSSTGQLATDATLAGQGTITASFGANGFVISPDEYSSLNNATGELQSQIDGKQPTLINNTPGTITNALGYTPPANTSGSITTALGYTPPANTSGSITTALGYTPPANTAGSITTALGYTPTDLGNSIALGTETTGNTDNISEGSMNKYHTDARVNAAVGSLTANTLSDVNINMNAENDFVKIVGNQLVAGSSSTIVAFTEVTGSATSSQLPSDPAFPGTVTAAGYLGMTESGLRRVGTNIVLGTPTDTLSIGSTSVTIGTTTTQPYRFSVYNEVGSAVNDVLIFGGLATADAEDGGTASSAIDDNAGTYWQATTALPHTWQYDFGTSNSRTVTQLTLDAFYSGSGRQDKDWSLQACNDTVSWGTITTGQDTNAAGVQTYNIPNTTSYRYYRLVFTTTWHVSGASIALQEIQMFPGAGNSLAVTYGGATLVGNRLLVGTGTPAGTSAANYVVQTGLNQRILSGGNDIYCFGSIKSIIDSGESVINKSAEIAKKTKLFEYHPKKLDLPKEQIEKFAREKYRHSFAVQDFETFKINNEANYKTNKPGTYTINYKKMKEDFEELYGEPREDEFYSLLDVDDRILEMETMLESDTNIINISPISTDPSTDPLLKGANPEYLSQTNMIGVLFGAFQDLSNQLGSATAEIEKLKTIISP